MFRWREEGGPVWPPTQKGFGSAVLEQVMAEYLMRRRALISRWTACATSSTVRSERCSKTDAAPFFQGGADKVAPPYRRLSTEGRKHRRF
jgi:hypothetical protein